MRMRRGFIRFQMRAESRRAVRTPAKPKEWPARGQPGGALLSGRARLISFASQKEGC